MEIPLTPRSPPVRTVSAPHERRPSMVDVSAFSPSTPRKSKSARAVVIYAPESSSSSDVNGLKNVTLGAHPPDVPSFREQQYVGLAFLQFLGHLFHFTPTAGCINDMERFQFLIITFNAWLASGPLAVAAFIWVLCVLLSGAVLVLSMSQLLTLHLITTEENAVWMEVSSQVINSLFTAMALWNQFIYPFWGGRTLLTLRFLFGDYKSLLLAYKFPSSLPRSQCALLILLLDLNVIFQYPINYFMWFYSASERPFTGILPCVACSALSGVLGGALEAKAADLGKEEWQERKAKDPDGNPGNTLLKDCP